MKMPDRMSVTQLVEAGPALRPRNDQHSIAMEGQVNVSWCNTTGPGTTVRRAACPLRFGPWRDIVRAVYRYVGSPAPPIPWVTPLHAEEDVESPGGNPDRVIAMVRSADIAKLRWGGPVVDTVTTWTTAVRAVGFDARHR